HFNDATSKFSDGQAKIYKADAYVYRLLLRRQPGVLWTKVFPSTMLTVERADVNRQSEDILTVLNVLRAGGSVRQYGDSIYKYRERGSSLSRQQGYDLGSIDRYSECIEKVTGSEWWTERGRVPVDYFSLSR